MERWERDGAIINSLVLVCENKWKKTPAHGARRISISWNMLLLLTVHLFPPPGSLRRDASSTWIWIWTKVRILDPGVAQGSMLGPHIFFFTRCHLRESVWFCWRTLLQSSKPKSLSPRSTCENMSLKQVRVYSLVLFFNVLYDRLLLCFSRLWPSQLGMLFSADSGN